MTPRQVRFVKEYLQDMNATQAYIRAGYSARTSNRNCARLMRHPEVRKLIDAAMADRAVAIRVTAVTQIEGLTKAARADLLAARDELKAVARRLRAAAAMASRAEALAVPRQATPAIMPRPLQVEEIPLAAAPAVLDYHPILPRPDSPLWPNHDAGRAQVDYDPTGGGYHLP